MGFGKTRVDEVVDRYDTAEAAVHRRRRGEAVKDVGTRTRRQARQQRLLAQHPLDPASRTNRNRPRLNRLPPPPVLRCLAIDKCGEPRVRRRLGEQLRDQLARIDLHPAGLAGHEEYEIERYMHRSSSAAHWRSVLGRSHPVGTSQSMGCVRTEARLATLALSVDIVIPAFGRYDLTNRCLAHLAQQTYKHNVIVSDNGSSAEDVQRLGRDWPKVRLVRSDKRLGFAAACNSGVAMGDGEVVVLLNNDVFCHPEWLERLLAPIAEDPTVGSVACLLLQPGERLIDSVGLCADITLAGFPRLAGLPAERAHDESPVLVGPAGAAGAYRREAWHQAGGLDEAIFAYSEDLDLALRLRGNGWCTRAAPEARGTHLGSATYGHRTTFQRRHAGFARGYLLRRYGVLKTRAALRTLLAEAAVVIGNTLLSGDLVALSARIAGWRAASELPRRQIPPETLDPTITLRRSLALRRALYVPRPAS
jgi:N-acetylglucosaminyl-diphospho-decaprenol L-rhamnosyltransferase